MTQFNPENKDKLTYGEALSPAMAITDKEDAAQYKTAYIKFTKSKMEIEPNKEGFMAEDIVNANLGYFAGYYDDETRARVEKLFICAHPVFGSIKDNKVTSEEAFEMGKNSAN